MKTPCSVIRRQGFSLAALLMLLLSLASPSLRADTGLPSSLLLPPFVNTSQGVLSTGTSFVYNIGTDDDGNPRYEHMTISYRPSSLRLALR